MHVSRLLRWVAPLAIAGGLIAGTVPAANAITAAYGITIGANSAYPKVSGDTLVIYKAKGYNSATISGAVTGFGSSDTATLWAKPFGAKSFSATTDTQALTASTTNPADADYSFSVTPSRATAYEVQVTTAGVTQADVTSTSVTVYVTERVKLTDKRNSCTTSSCKFSYHIYLYLPAAAYKTESRKHMYLYLAIGYPKLPKDYTLNTTATASKPKKISSGEYELVLTWHITLHRGSNNWETTFCTKDTESKDGMGLPGHHGCGNKHVSMKTTYLG